MTHRGVIDHFLQRLQLHVAEDLVVLWDQFGTPLKKEANKVLIS